MTGEFFPFNFTPEQKMQRSTHRLLTAMVSLLLIPLGSCGGSANGGSTPPAPLQLAASEVALRVPALSRMPRLPRCPAAPTPLRKISTVHGSSRQPAQIGQQVTLRGVVTADFEDRQQLHGFFMQQVAAPSKTHSDGLLINLPTRAHRVASGSYIQVSGTVEQIRNRAGRRDGQIRLGKITDVTVCGDGPMILPRLLTLPVQSSKQLEALDGMLVRIPQTLTVTDNHDLGYRGDLMLSADARLWQPTNHPTLSDPDAIVDANLRSQITLGDGSNATHPAPLPYLSTGDTNGTRRVGDTVAQLEGVLTQSFGTWRLQPTLQPLFADANPRPALPAAVGGAIRVASLNVLSYFTTLDERGAKSATELQRQRDKLVAAIAGLDADAIGLMEIENSSDALADLVGAINARLGAGTYAAIDSLAQGSDAIKVALIYKPSRLSPLGEAEAPPPVRGDGGISTSRPSLAQRFTVRDSAAGFWMIVNHLKSKSRCPLNGNNPDSDAGQGCWNATRIRQIKAIARWSDALGQRYAQPNLLVLGDFNAYLDEDPIQALRASGFEDLLQRMPPAERYSYVFDGRSGALDHAFVDATLQAKVTGATIWHINADEPSVLDYTLSGKTDDRYAATPFRASDHDPLLIGLDL